MNNVQHITIDEAAWLIKAFINTANAAGEPVNLDEVTPDAVAEEIHRKRTIESTFQALMKNAKEVNGGTRDQNNILDDVIDFDISFLR